MKVAYALSTSSEEVSFQPLIGEREDRNNRTNNRHKFGKWIENIKSYTKNLVKSTRRKPLISKHRKTICYIVLALLLFTYIIWIINIHLSELSNKSPIFSHVPGMKGYVVWSDKCKMRDIDPFFPEAETLFEKAKCESCVLNKPFTEVKFDQATKKYKIFAYTDYASFLKGPLSCCYEKIERNFSDNSVHFSPCMRFVGSAELDRSIDNILVRCKVSKYKYDYSSFAMQPERSEIRNRINYWKQNDNQTRRPVSVLMLGVNGVSMANLKRRMPKTLQYLYENEWFEMSGYNKVAANTFSNLMAILTGYNERTSSIQCNATQKGALDECPFIWKTFKERGYVTVYAEDATDISTFNHLKVGFVNPPADYYLRPFLLGVKQKYSDKTKNEIYCLGYHPQAFYVYDYALEMVRRFRDDPYFGFFWSNSFSQNDAKGCLTMDNEMYKYLIRFANEGVFEESIVILLSNHEELFQPLRNTDFGFLKDQKPFLFISIPPWLYHAHPELINALGANKNRLTSPFDLHMTLKHILELSGRIENLPPTEDCPNCQSLLKFLDHNRQCVDAGIEEKWCACQPYQIINRYSDIVKNISSFTMNYINDLFIEYNNNKNGSLVDECETLNLEEILSAEILRDEPNVTVNTYKIYLKTVPYDAIFDTTVQHDVDEEKMKVTGNITRLNSFTPGPYCTFDNFTENYCICENSLLMAIG